MAKNWYKSRTMWVNALVAVGGILTALAGELQAGGTLTAVGLANIVLRYITTTAVK